MRTIAHPLSVVVVGTVAATGVGGYVLLYLGVAASWLETCSIDLRPYTAPFLVGCLMPVHFGRSGTLEGWIVASMDARG